MNAPKDKLEEIIAVLPGMKSPTVISRWHRKAGALSIQYLMKNVFGKSLEN